MSRIEQNLSGFVQNLLGWPRLVFYRYLPLLVIGFIAAFAIYQSLHLFQYDHFYDWTFLFAGLGAGFVLLFSKAARDFFSRANAGLVMMVIIVAAGAVRVHFMGLLPTQPIFDYAAYQLAAESVSQGNLEALTLLEGKPWGYPLLLGLVYWAGGISLFWAQLLNLALSLISIILVFMLVNRLMGQEYALLTAFLYAFLPSQIFMNNVVNSEILFIALILAGLYFSIKFMQDLAWSSLIATGLFLGLAQVVRPVAMIYLLVFGGFLVLQMGPQHIGRLFKYALAALLSFYLVMMPFLVLKSFIYKQPVLWEKGTFGMVFVMGTNVDSGGYWNQSDYDHLKSLLIKYDNDAEKVNKEAFKLAMWRLQRSEDFKLMIPSKISNMWSIDTFGFEWANNGTGNEPIITDEHELRNYRGVSQLYYAFIVLMIWSGIARRRLEDDAGYRYFTAILLAFVVLHIFIEVQGRYHMHLTPIFLIMLAYGFLKSDHHEEATAYSVGFTDSKE